MAKRFTDSNKWKDTWFQDLPTKYKLFWIYLLDECDHAGLWKPNLRLAIFLIGEDFKEDDLIAQFNGRIEVTSKGYWFVKKFIDFQYGELSESSKPHQSVLKTLKNHEIKGYTKGIDTLKEKEKEKDKDIDITNTGEIEISNCLEIALNDEKWIRLNKTSRKELEVFNEKLMIEGINYKLPIDYKTHFARWKKKEPEELKSQKTFIYR
jgi:hypothetical protein